MKTEILINEDRTKIFLMVELPERGAKEDPKEFNTLDAKNFLLKKKYKIGRALSPSVVSNISKTRRKGQFVFKLNEKKVVKLNVSVEPEKQLEYVEKVKEELKKPAKKKTTKKRKKKETTTK